MLWGAGDVLIIVFAGLGLKLGILGSSEIEEVLDGDDGLIGIDEGGRVGCKKAVQVLQALFVAGSIGAPILAHRVLVELGDRECGGLEGIHEGLLAGFVRVEESVDLGGGLGRLLRLLRLARAVHLVDFVGRGAAEWDRFLQGKARKWISLKERRVWTVAKAQRTGGLVLIKSRVSRGRARKGLGIARKQKRKTNRSRTGHMTPFLRSAQRPNESNRIDKYC